MPDSARPAVPGATDDGVGEPEDVFAPLPTLRRAPTRASQGSRLRLALPSKGRMEEPTLAFLRECGLQVRRPNPRQYTASLRGYPNVEVLFQRARDVYWQIEQGNADAGIMGYDVLCEQRREGDQVIMLYDDLGYSRCDLVLALPQSWLDVTSVTDLADLAQSFHERGRDLRVATEFTNLVRRFLLRRGIPYFNLVTAQGALEIAPSLGYADLIADITESGTTLRDNHLKTIAGGTILNSRACLIANARALKADPAKLEAVRAILELIEGHLRARNQYSITANVRADSPETLARYVLSEPDLAGIQGPTIARVYSKSEPDDWYAVTIVASEDRLLQVLQHLRRAGGSGVSVIPSTYIFSSACESFERLCRTLSLGASPPRKE